MKLRQGEVGLNRGVPWLSLGRRVEVDNYTSNKLACALYPVRWRRPELLRTGGDVALQKIEEAEQGAVFRILSHAPTTHTFIAAPKLH